MNIFPLTLIPNDTRIDFMRMRWVALGIAALLVLQTVMLRRKYPGGLLPNPARAPG